jgi:hypothetical protein
MRKNKISLFVLMFWILVAGAGFTIAATEYGLSVPGGDGKIVVGVPDEGSREIVVGSGLIGIPEDSDSERRVYPGNPIVEIRPNFRANYSLKKSGNSVFYGGELKRGNSSVYGVKVVEKNRSINGSFLPPNFKNQKTYPALSEEERSKHRSLDDFISGNSEVGGAVSIPAERGHFVKITGWARGFINFCKNLFTGK